MTSMGRLNGRLMPSWSAPVTRWIGRLVRGGGVTARNAKSRFWFCEVFQPRATVILFTTQAPWGAWPERYPGMNAMFLKGPPEYTQWAAVRTMAWGLLLMTLAVQ